MEEKYKETKNIEEINPKYVLFHSALISKMLDDIEERTQHIYGEEINLQVDDIVYDDSCDECIIVNHQTTCDECGIDTSQNDTGYCNCSSQTELKTIEDSI